MRAKILVVDDEPANLELLVRTLRKRYDVVTATSGAEALELLGRDHFSAIVSDQRMPHMTGTEFLAEARRRVPETVRLILTGYAPEKESVEAINLAQVSSFLTKPVTPDVVERAVADAVELHDVTVKHAAVVAELAEKNRELADAKAQLEQRLAGMASHDPLTGMLNHRAVHERLAGELDRIARYGGAVSLVLCDVDHFKLFNEANGHVAGDELLVALARLLSGAERASGFALRPTDLVGRWGGEEFALLVPGTTKGGAAAMCGRIRDAVAAANVPGASLFPSGHVTLSFGIAEAPLDGRSKGQLVEAAERALQRAKEAGRDRIEVA